MREIIILIFLILVGIILIYPFLFVIKHKGEK